MIGQDDCKVAVYSKCMKCALFVHIVLIIIFQLWRLQKAWRPWESVGMNVCAFVPAYRVGIERDHSNQQLANELTKRERSDERTLPFFPLTRWLNDNSASVIFILFSDLLSEQAVKKSLKTKETQMLFSLQFWDLLLQIPPPSCLTDWVFDLFSLLPHSSVESHRKNTGILVIIPGWIVLRFCLCLYAYQWWNEAARWTFWTTTDCV